MAGDPSDKMSNRRFEKCGRHSGSSRSLSLAGLGLSLEKSAQPRHSATANSSARQAAQPAGTSQPGHGSVGTVDGYSGDPVKWCLWTMDLNFM